MNPGKLSTDDIQLIREQICDIHSVMIIDLCNLSIGTRTDFKLLIAWLLVDSIKLVSLEANLALSPK